MLEAFDGIAVTLTRKYIMQGDLKAAAMLLIQPSSRASCAITFLAEIEPSLDVGDLQELRELWKQPAHDKIAALGRRLREP